MPFKIVLDFKEWNSNLCLFFRTHEQSCLSDSILVLNSSIKASLKKNITEWPRTPLNVTITWFETVSVQLIRGTYKVLWTCIGKPIAYSQSREVNVGIENTFPIHLKTNLLFEYIRQDFMSNHNLRITRLKEFIGHQHKQSTDIKIYGVNVRSP